MRRQAAMGGGMTVALRATVILALAFLCASRAAAQPAKKAAGAAERVVMRVQVLSVEGTAQKRSMADPGGKWEAVKPGETLGAQTLLRTGLGAKVVLVLADRGRVTVKSATKIGIGEFQKQGPLAKVRLGLKYGTMRVYVDDRPGPNDLQVKTPVATLSVRGCGANFSIGERGLRFCVFEHQWDVQLADGRTQRIGEKACTDEKLTPWRKLLRTDQHVSVIGVGATGADADSVVENAGGRAIFDQAGGDGGRWLFGGHGSPNGHPNQGDCPTQGRDVKGPLPGYDK